MTRTTSVTPEARERQARREVGRTTFHRGAMTTLCIGFGAVLVSGLASQIARDVADETHGWPRTLDPVRLLPVRDEIRGIASDEGWAAALAAANQRLLDNVREYEARLEESSPLIEALVPPVDLVVTDVLGGATESVYPGRDGWLFFRPDVEYVTNAGFLDRSVLDARLRTHPELEPDPVPALVELREALRARDIELLVVPAPVKPSINPERYSGRHEAGDAPVQNPSYEAFLERLDEADIRYVDLAAVLSRSKAVASAPLYLRTDTHWTPYGMRVAAEAIARAVRDIAVEWNRPAEAFSTTPVEVRNIGDTMALLRLPRSLANQRMEAVTIDQVSSPDGRLWSADPDAEILFLGDSFANIYSLPSLGWGTAAGLVEQVSTVLGRGMDVLAINDDGSHATRAMLAGQMRQGNDRLAGKRMVIYEFASRELATGDWRTGLSY